MNPHLTDTMIDPDGDTGCAVAASVGAGSVAGRGSDFETAMKIMEQEQIDDYNEYIKLCGGIPISKIKP